MTSFITGFVIVGGAIFAYRIVKNGTAKEAKVYSNGKLISTIMIDVGWIFTKNRLANVMAELDLPKDYDRIDCFDRTYSKDEIDLMIKEVV